MGLRKRSGMKLRDRTKTERQTCGKDTCLRQRHRLEEEIK
jgi:hypothetical protein